MTFRLLSAEQGSRPSESQGTETSLSGAMPNATSELIQPEKHCLVVLT